MKAKQEIWGKTRRAKNLIKMAPKNISYNLEFLILNLAVVFDGSVSVLSVSFVRTFCAFSQLSKYVLVLGTCIVLLGILTCYSLQIKFRWTSLYTKRLSKVAMSRLFRLVSLYVRWLSSKLFVE